MKIRIEKEYFIRNDVLKELLNNKNIPDTVKVDKQRQSGIIKLIKDIFNHIRKKS